MKIMKQKILHTTYLFTKSKVISPSMSESMFCILPVEITERLPINIRMYINLRL